ncbi:MAG: outer membrane beta-barrel protein [Ferruginibacter sp.]
MQENNFEKQVQQKTDELKLKPSDEVWQKVAVAIAKRKNDRRVFVLFYLLLLIICTSVFIMWDHSSNKKINDTISKNSDGDKTNHAGEQINDSNARQIAGALHREKTGNKNSAVAQQGLIKDIPPIKKTASHKRTAPVQLPVEKTISVAVGEPADNNNITVYKKDEKRGVDGNTKKISYETKQQPTISVSNGNPVDLASEMTGSADTSKTKIARLTPVINEVAINERIVDPVSKENTGIKMQAKDTMAEIQKTGLEKNISTKSLPQQKQKINWKIGFTLSAGVATTQNGYLGIIGPGSNDEFKSYLDPAQSSNGGNAGQGPYIPHVPSKIKAGTGFVLGIFVQKNISPKANFLLGLNYKTYSSRMMIGNRVNNSNSYFSLDNVFYSSGSMEAYKNHFHFLELPVSFRYRLGKQNRLPIYLKAGVAISKFIGSNALQFDTAGYYYKNNDLLNKTQLSVSAGLLFSFPGHAKNAILIGPDINFSLNKMARSGLYKDRHYSYFGIQVQKSIGKK